MENVLSLRETRVKLRVCPFPGMKFDVAEKWEGLEVPIVQETENEYVIDVKIAFGIFKEKFPKQYKWAQSDHGELARAVEAGFRDTVMVIEVPKWHCEVITSPLQIVMHS